MRGNRPYRPPAIRLEFRVVLVQMVVIALAALILGLAGRDGLSALVGGGCVWFPNAWMALRINMGRTQGDALRGAYGLVLAMIAKLVLTAVLIALVFWKFPAIDAAAFFAGLLAAIMAHHTAFLLRSDRAI